MQNSVSKKIIQKWLETLPKKKIDDFLVKSLDDLNKKGNLGNEKDLTSVINDFEGHHAKDKVANS
mgnify:CR=1 FL=1